LTSLTLSRRVRAWHAPIRPGSRTPSRASPTSAEGTFARLAFGSALPTPHQHAAYWLGVAAICASFAIADLVRRYGLLPRHATALALGQLTPALGVGIVLAIAL
jgi:hypothetical protein